MSRLGKIGLLISALLLFAAFLATAPREVPSALIATDLGAERGDLIFYGDDFGGLSASALETHAIPWRLVATALALEQAGEARQADAADIRAAFQAFGFLFPETFGNAALTERGERTMPLGMTYGDLSPIRGLPVRIANLGCSSCHAGTTYAPDGSPTPERAWLGMPNTSLDLEAYTLAVFRALRRQAADPDRLLAETRRLFPDMGWRERTALRWLVLPRVRGRLETLAEADRPLPFPNGHPGNTNGVAALKLALGVPMTGGGARETGTVSIPDLGHRSWRTSLLVDGAYAVPGEARQRETVGQDVTPARLEALAAMTTFFTVPSMGVHPDRSARSQENAAAVLGFLDRYSPQPFPGPIDRETAHAGARLYARDCASCHGRYDDSGERPRLVSFPNWLGDAGTDGARAAAFDARLAEAVNASGYRERISARHTGHYAAPPLAGIWASAPYLHNGSVPTIAALLDPASRPARFQVGGHALDFGRLGLLLGPDGGFPAGYRPWSRPAWIDTRRPGLSNGGHAFGSGLSAAEQRQLVEYLKLL